MGSLGPCAQNRASLSAWVDSASHRTLFLVLSISFVFSSLTEQDQECLCCHQGWVGALGFGRGQTKAALCRNSHPASWGQGWRGPSAICSGVTPPHCSARPHWSLSPQGGLAAASQECEGALVMLTSLQETFPWPFPTLPHSPGEERSSSSPLGSCWGAGAAAGLHN